MEESIQAIKKDLHLLEQDIVNQFDEMEGEIQEMNELLEEFTLREKKRKFIKPKERNFQMEYENLPTLNYEKQSNYLNELKRFHKDVDFDNYAKLFYDFLENDLKKENIMDCILVKDWIYFGYFFQILYLNSRNDKMKERCCKMEKDFGNRMIQKFYKAKNIKENGQWTTVFGEHLVADILRSKGFQNIQKIRNLNIMEDDTIARRMPDWGIFNESNELQAIIEVKSRTYTITGTAGEKILYSFMKYDNYINGKDIPFLLVCVGYQEVEAEMYFHLFEDSVVKYNGRFLRAFMKFLQDFKKYTKKCSYLWGMTMDEFRLKYEI